MFAIAGLSDYFRDTNNDKYFFCFILKYKLRQYGKPIVPFVLL